MDPARYGSEDSTGKIWRMRILQTLVFVLAAAAFAAAQAPSSGAIPAPPDVAAPPADAVKTASGLATKVLAPGTGKEHPAKEDVVTIHYTGWKTDGTMFDSSVARGKPASFPVARVIAGFSEGLQLMVPGREAPPLDSRAARLQGRARAEGHAGVRHRADRRPQLRPRAPADVKAPPADAKKTASGLAYKTLKQGTGGRHPKSSSQVTVHYTGWTTDGKMFDSSVERGEPATFALDGVIPGWTEGLQLMYEGEKARFWIPEKPRLQRQERALRHAGLRRRADQDPVRAGLGSARPDVSASARSTGPARSRRRPAAGSTRAAGRPAPAIAAGCRRASVMRRIARWKRSASARRASSGTGPMRDQLACACRTSSLRGAEAAVVVDLAADRVGGERFLQHRRQPASSATARRRRSPTPGRRATSRDPPSGAPALPSACGSRRDRDRCRRRPPATARGRR